MDTPRRDARRLPDRRPLAATVAGAALLLCAAGLAARAQPRAHLPTARDTWSWPDELVNMQVLPSEWSGERLAPVMQGFSRALGVRCSHCHVGEEGAGLETYDFASDENPNKDRAREMLRMLGSVNEHLAALEPSGDRRVNMWCHTCHRGRPRPMTLGEELGEARRAGGSVAALGRYTELKEAYYGRGVFDFRDEGTLNALGYEALEAGDNETAVATFRLNTEAFPDSANAWDSLAEAYMTAGDLEQARAHYRKSLELDPRNQNAREMLEKLE